MASGHENLKTSMPLVLMQARLADDPKYKDTEFVVYHYPRQYFDQILGARGSSIIAGKRREGR